MAKPNDISTQILQKIVNSESNNVVIDNDSFFTSLAGGDKYLFHKRAARLIAIALIAIAMIAFVIYSAVFYIQNVVLYSGNWQVNQFGTFIRKSYNSEYAMFLFDSSEQWAPSGIQVQEGDELIISASGAFHTNYIQLVNAAKENRWADFREDIRLDINRGDAILDTITSNADMYRYVYMTKQLDEKSEMKKMLPIDTMKRKVRQPINYKRHWPREPQPALFGDVLFQIIPEYQVRTMVLDTTTTKIYAIPRAQTQKSIITIKQNGLLAFCVNDINHANNIGQILVVAEIFHQYDKSQAKRHFFCGKILEWPYYRYNYLSHLHNYPTRSATSRLWMLWCSIVLCMWVLIEIVSICALLYILPFLFIPETWVKVRHIYQHKVKPLYQKFFTQ